MEHLKTIGKYELLQFLGGGMSHVYRARDTVIDRTVVVKILTDDGCKDADAKARFLQEARVAGGIQHDNIVAVYDYGEHDGHPFIVMEFLRGEDLREAIRENHLAGMPARLKVALQIAEALEFVNNRGIVHRDIKPENIHIDLTGRIKLMDFGIAKTADLSLTRTGVAMGTPYYMAPEQVSGGAITPLVDIYAYGMLLYELLTGLRGITGETMEQVFFQIISQPLDASKLSTAGTPAAVRDLVLRCTAKKKEDRPQSFREIIQELRAAIDPTTTKKIEIPSASLPLDDQATRAVPIQPSPGQTASSRPPMGTLPVTSLPAASRTSPPEAPVEPRVEPAKSSGKTMLVAAVVGVVVIGAVIALWLRPRQPAAIPGMIYIPAGTFLSGADKKPATLGAFYIDETEVTNSDFAEFCRASGCPAPSGGADLPAVRVTVAQARAFAKWKGKRIPTANEWERAARGQNGSRYPWGDADDPTRANVSENSSLTQHGLMPVRSFAAAPAYQMAGNAWEMVDGDITPSTAAVALFSTLLTPPPTQQEKWIAIRGGSFNTPLAAAVSYEWSPIPERYSSGDIGFRCARDP
jgi:serine/threonine-protein kinase